MSSWVSEADTRRMCLGLYREETLGAAVHSPACTQSIQELGQGAREDEEEGEKAEMRGLQEVGTNHTPPHGTVHHSDHTHSLK